MGTGELFEFEKTGRFEDVQPNEKEIRENKKGTIVFKKNKHGSGGGIGRRLTRSLKSISKKPAR